MASTQDRRDHGATEMTRLLGNIWLALSLDQMLAWDEFSLVHRQHLLGLPAQIE